MPVHPMSWGVGATILILLATITFNDVSRNATPSYAAVIRLLVMVLRVLKQLILTPANWCGPLLGSKFWPETLGPM